MILATLNDADLSLVGWLIVAACILGAGYMAYVGNALACILLLIVAVFAGILLA